MFASLNRRLLVYYVLKGFAHWRCLGALRTAKVLFFQVPFLELLVWWSGLHFSTHPPRAPETMCTLDTWQSLVQCWGALSYVVHSKAFIRFWRADLRSVKTQSKRLGSFNRVGRVTSEACAWHIKAFRSLPASCILERVSTRVTMVCLACVCVLWAYDISATGWMLMASFLKQTTAGPRATCWYFTYIGPCANRGCSLICVHLSFLLISKKYGGH